MPGPRSGGRIGAYGEPGFDAGAVEGPGPPGEPGELPKPPGNISTLSPGSSSANIGGMNSGVSSSSLSGSVAATGRAATGDSRLPQRTRARFAPSEISVSPAGIIILFRVQKTWLFRRYETYIATGRSS